MIHQSQPAIAAKTRALVFDYLEPIGGLALGREQFLDRVEQLTELIALWGARINLTAQPGNPAELAFHVIDSLMPLLLAEAEPEIGETFGPGSQVLDLGSGAGFPGLVLAALSPARFTLLEHRRKRASFLAVAAAKMRLSNVVISRSITRDRGYLVPSDEHAQDPARYDLVMARAFAAAPTFHALAAWLLKPDALAILYANPGQELDLTGAGEKGLGNFRRLPYMVPRDGGMVERLLALWRKRKT